MCVRQACMAPIRNKRSAAGSDPHVVTAGKGMSRRAPHVARAGTSRCALPIPRQQDDVRRQDDPEVGRAELNGVPNLPAGSERFIPVSIRLQPSGEAPSIGQACKASSIQRVHHLLAATAQGVLRVIHCPEFLSSSLARGLHAHNTVCTVR